MSTKYPPVVCLLLAVVAGTASAQVAEKKTLTIDGAKIVAAAAAEEAHRNNAGGSIAIVDTGGNLLAPAATYIPAETVRAAFARGVPLIESEAYKVHASRREAPGMAEVHERDTDIIYVLEGTATLVTGGTVVEASTIATGEIRGTSIRGGKEQRLARGDVFVVPQGVPHQFTEVPGPFLYYVVKATGPAGGMR